MAADVKLAKEYEVRARDVSMSLTIGEGQFGTSDVLLDGKRIARASGSIGNLRIGTGTELVGKDLLVRSIVNDVSRNTNRMSVKYSFVGGSIRQEFIAKGSVADEGELLVFEGTFSFVKA